MAIAYVQQGSQGAINAGACTITTSATSAGDFVLLVAGDGDTTDNVMGTPTAPASGWTDAGSSEQYSNQTVDANARLWYIYPSAGTTTFTVPGTGGGTNCGSCAALMVFSGVASVAQGGPFSTAITKTTGTGANPDSPSIATTSTDFVVSAVVGTHATTMGTYTAPTNYTTNANLGTAGNDTNASRAGMAYRASGFANPEDPGSWTLSTSVSTDGWCSYTVALKAAPLTLTVQAATSATTIDNVALVQHNILAVQNSASATTIDNVVLTQHNVLAVQNMASATAMDNLTLVATEGGGGEDSTAVARTERYIARHRDRYNRKH